MDVLGWKRESLSRYVHHHHLIRPTLNSLRKRRIFWSAAVDKEEEEKETLEQETAECYRLYGICHVSPSLPVTLPALGYQATVIFLYNNNNNNKTFLSLSERNFTLWRPQCPSPTPTPFSWWILVVNLTGQCQSFEWHLEAIVEPTMTPTHSTTRHISFFLLFKRENTL